MSEIFEAAERKAKYGRRDWICWRDRDGQERAEPVSQASLKAALLATGTKGRFFRTNGHYREIVRWRIGIVMWRNHNRNFAC